MPITLRDSLEPLVLRDSARYAPGQAQGATYLEAQDTNPLTRGWNATDEGLVASQLLAEANAAERKGDIGLSQALQRRAQDHMQQAQTWAPTTQNFDEINGLGSGAEWLAGSVGGGLRSMIAPVAGGALGSLAGGAVGMLTRNPGLGARAAQVLAPSGAFVPGYDMAYNETVGQAMMDPEVRARSTAQDIHNTGQVGGAVSGALDAIVPAGMAKIAVGGMGKRLAGRTITKGMVDEGITEGAQNLVGQTAQNQLRGDDLTNYDYRSAFNDAMAGAVAGGAISAGGVGVGKLRDKIAAGGEAVADTARDPVGKVIEAMKARAEKQGREQAQQEIAAGNTPLEKMFQQSAEQAASDRFFDPAPRDATDEEVSASARASADQWADKILSSQPRTFGPREGKLREAAAQYKSDGDWLKFRAVLKENNLRTTQDEMAASFDTGEKASEMTPEGKELEALSKAWLANEGKRFGEYFDGSDEANGLGAKLFAWIKSDFGKKLTENGEIFIPRAFIEALGDRAPGVVESAVTAARKEGWDIRDAGDAVKAIRDYVSSNEGDFGFLNSAIRYSQQNNWTPKMVRQFAKELRRKNGQLNKDDYRWFKTQVGDIVGVLEHFQKPSKYYKAEKNMGLKSDAGLTQAARDQDEKVGVTENDGDWSSGVSEKEPVSKRDYLQEDEFFDIRDPEQRAVMEKMSADAAAVRTQSSDAKRVVRVGILDRYLEKAAEERGVAPDALAPQTRDKITRDLVHEYFPSFERLPPAPKNVSALTEKQYRERKSQYETGLKRRANLLNQKLVTLAVESVGMEKLGTQIAASDVHMKNANPTDPKYGAHRGTIILRTYTKDGKVASRPFVTSTQMIISKMFKASDSAGASTKRYEGTAQEMLQLLSDGITSVLQDKRFGGEGKKMRIGTLRNGEPQWFDGSDIRTWPKNLVIFRDKAMRPYTLGEALEQEKLQSKNTLSFDYDPDENDPGRNDKVREKAPWEMRQELKTLLNNETDKPVRAKIIQALRAKDEAGNRNDQPVIYLWNELVESGKLKSSDTVTELGSTRGNMIEEGQVGPDTLAAYDPDYIKRDERGDMLSSSVEYTAQSRIGTSKSVEPKDSKKFDPATKAMPGLRKGSGVEIRMEEAKQRFVDLMRNGVQTVLDSVATMAPKDLALFKTAFAEFAKLSSANVDALAKEYFQGDKNAARMFTTRLMRSNVAIRDAIDARGEVNKNGQLPGSKEKANGEARQADSAGTEARVVAQPGRGRATKDGELGAGQQGRDAEDGVVKQDAWVMKVASLPRKDLKAFVNALPKEKLKRAVDVLESFFPVDNTNPFWQRNDLDNYTDAKSDTVFEAQELIRDRLSEDGEAKASEQATSDQTIDPKQALEDIARMLGKDYDAKVVKNLGGKAGTWTKSGIKLATSAANGTQYHEALHEMFSQMRKHGADNVRELIERVASSPLIMRKLEQLLEGHPKAIKQLKTPEEAAAFLFQFWNMGLINVGPETKSLFQTIKDWIANVAKDLYAAVNAGAREKRAGEKAAKMDQAEVRRLFEGLAAGGVANPDTRAAVYDALRKNAEAHQKAIDELGQRAEKFWRGMGKYVVTSETMLNLYSKHPELKNLIADRFHQMAGKSMKNQARDASLTARGGYIEAVHGETQRRLTKFERFLMDTKFDQKDMELAAKHLEANTQSSDEKIQSLIDFVHDYYGEMYDYATQSDVRRLDPNHPDRWVPLQKRKNYFTQSWSIEELSKDHDGFVSTLLDKHLKELEGMAKQANAELVAWNKNPDVKVQSPTAKNEVERAIAEFEQSGQIVGKLGINPVTPEMIAETIYTRLLNSTGLVDIQESEWSLGITPAAAAVNRRELDWLDKEAFSKYKSKDLVEIVTSYTRTMVKRAEYQKRFGYSGEVIAEAMDTAFLREMGGDKLVDDASTALLSAISAWKKAYAEFKAENPDATFPEHYPTLRMVGADLHRSQVGEDKANADMVAAEETLRPAINAVRAMEGTLGNEIGQGMRSFNSWVNTYQNVRLLPLALFTNFSDVIGVTVQGGTLGDAWDAFTAGIREVRNTWVNEKGEDKRTMRAEEWGVSDAGALLDTLGQNYSSVYMNEKARAVNNKFFRIIGMEGWNRGVRITASAVGERVIMNWVSNGVDAKKPGEQARFERLYGEGFDPKSIKLDKGGNLDTSDAANRAAIQRFVQDAVMSSNPAVRATWMSDPRMATFAHLKNFAYAFHSVMLKGILAQAAQGNLRPALVAGLGYASIAIAAGAIKEMLIPGDEPFWMQGGLDGYLEYGYTQANLGGVPQLWFDGVSKLDPAKLAGPFWDQIQNTLSAPLPGLKLNLSPVDGETDIISDRKLAVELAKALPAGNLAGRAMDSLIGE